jgi:hypothetical protein
MDDLDGMSCLLRATCVAGADDDSVYEFVELVAT